MNETTRNQTNNSNPAVSSSSDTMDRISKNVHEGIDSAAKAVHPGIDRIAEGAHKAVQNADEMANHAAETLEKAGVKGEEILNASTSYLRDHPLLTLGLAVTAGYVLSRVLAAR
ncbi:MAG: hypothetical protein ACXIUM_07385 [Wenzhouxiangella sp.]